MGDNLPKDYDVIVLGTGMVECIFAAAAARVGKSVLHLDRNGFYGGDWSSFNLDHLQKFVRSEENDDSETVKPAGEEIFEGETTLKCSNFKTISNVNEEIHVKLESDVVEEEHSPGLSEKSTKHSPGDEVSKEGDDGDQLSEGNVNTMLEESRKSEDVTETSNSNKDAIDPSAAPVDETDQEKAKLSSNEWSWQKILKDFRRFNLDLSPKLLFSRGDLVELLISSNVARYAEYKCLTRILTYKDRLEQVPCSRSDVFSTKHISIIDKRMLMQLLNFCLEFNFESEENAELKKQLFTDFLKKRKLSESVCHNVIHAIAMVPTTATVEEGLISTKKFLKSLGRFGNTPFLWPMYGSGELPQCFCRLCAVFGGIYCLRKNVEEIIVNNDKHCNGIISDGERFNCKWLILDSTYAPQEYLPQNINENRMSRAILITDKSLAPATKEQISLLRLPPCSTHTAINFLELPPGSMVCPEGLHVVHATSESINRTSKEDLLEPVEQFFTPDQDNLDTKPRLLYSLYFNLIDTTKCDLNVNVAENMLITSNSGPSLDFDQSVIEAKKLFLKAFPDCEFLPRAPDPDEIILGEGETENDQLEESGGYQNQKANENQEVKSATGENNPPNGSDLSEIRENQEHEVTDGSNPPNVSDVSETKENQKDSGTDTITE